MFKIVVAAVASLLVSAGPAAAQTGACAVPELKVAGRTGSEPSRPGAVFCDCVAACPQMVVIPAGAFTMGSPRTEPGRDAAEGPVRTVRFRKPFAVGRFEVTAGEWAACVAAGGCPPIGMPAQRGWTGDRVAMTDVTWDEAKAYVAWLSRLTSRRYRLLSEAEWEYVARSGAPGIYPTGETITSLAANFKGLSGEPSRNRPVDVGSYPPNAFGVFDMMGNVWEWVEDAWHPDYKGAPRHGGVWGGGDRTFRVLRGGSWGDYVKDLRVAYRNPYTPDTRSELFGFRVARDLSVAAGAHR